MTACYLPTMDRRCCSLLVALAVIAACGVPRAELHAGEGAPGSALERPALASTPGSEWKVRRAEARPRTVLPLALEVSGTLSVELPIAVACAVVRPVCHPVERSTPSARVTRGPPAGPVGT
jgi:hypothetical protein